MEMVMRAWTRKKNTLGPFPSGYCVLASWDKHRSMVLWHDALPHHGPRNIRISCFWAEPSEAINQIKTSFLPIVPLKYSSAWQKKKLINTKNLCYSREIERVKKKVLCELAACRVLDAGTETWYSIYDESYCKHFALLHSRMWPVHSFLIDNVIHIIFSNMLMDKITFKITPNSYYQNFVHVTKWIVICAWKCHMRVE